MNKFDFDFSGWATRNNLKCSDGLTIIKDAFKGCDGKQVPLVWNHQHNGPFNVLGHAILENRDDGVYAYCKFNNTEHGQNAKELVKHGDISALSIYANQLKRQGGNVLHGSIREVSLVLAGANPGAFIDSVITHNDDTDEEAVIYTGEDLDLKHSNVLEEVEEETEEVEEETEEVEEETEEVEEETEEVEEKTEEETEEVEEETKEVEEDSMEHSDKTVQEVIDTFNEEQRTVFYGIIGKLIEEQEQEKSKDDEGEDKNMKHNVFEQDVTNNEQTLQHSDFNEILEMAKSRSVGTLKEAINIYGEENSLKHGINEIETLFPDYKDVKPGAPELITNDMGWVGHVMKAVHKSPISRIRTKQADARAEELRAKGYGTKGSKKEISGNITLMKRTTDPTTVYRKDALHRDDIVDITEFDVVAYQYDVMKMNLEEELALAFFIGDQREDESPDKIAEDKIRPIWKDNELYTIHYDVDIEGAKAELQGSNTTANFGENYIYAEAIIQAALYSREKYKGSGALEFYCTPHLLNVMLLARDLNGRRIYNSKADLAAALNVSAIYTVEQFEGKTRTDASGNVKKLLGIFVNLNDYYVGATKGGEITKFNQFDIDFNTEKYLIETRLSGALVKPWAAIALEEALVDE